MNEKRQRLEMIPKYEEDFYGWAMSTANLLRERKMDELDFNHLIEEMEALGKSNRRELNSRLSILIAHLMKWQYQNDIKSNSWKGTIVRQRLDILDLLEENPSLRSQIQDFIPKAYKYALAILQEETPLEIKSLPSECPYIFSELRDETFYPESDHVIKQELYAGSGLRD